MFDRARTACNIARGSYNERLIVFDNQVRERELLDERRQLEDEITAADKRLYEMERMAPMQRIARQQRAKAENDLARAKEHMRRYREGMIQREYQARIEKTSRRLIDVDRFGEIGWKI